MDLDQIEKCLTELNTILKRKKIKGELGICGGAAMCLAFNARKATKDIDGIFKPTKEIRAAIKEIASEFDLPEDWLNDGVKGFFHKQPEKIDIREYSNLRVWVPSPEYMLAMKCYSARLDSFDGDDIKFLIKLLKIKDKVSVFDIVSQYCPNNKISPKTQFMIEELFDSLNSPA